MLNDQVLIGNFKLQGVTADFDFVGGVDKNLAGLVHAVALFDDELVLGEGVEVAKICAEGAGGCAGDGVFVDAAERVELAGVEIGFGCEGCGGERIYAFGAGFLAELFDGFKVGGD